MAVWQGSVVVSSPEQRREDLRRLRRVRDRIDREFHLPLDVESLARAEHISAGHLSRQFKVAYGESVYSYLMTRRVERAMAMLRQSPLSVTDICMTVGCSSLGTFSSRFSELVGMSPTTYRQWAGTHEVDALPPCLVRRVSRPVRNEEARPWPAS